MMPVFLARYFPLVCFASTLLGQPSSPAARNSSSGQEFEAAAIRPAGPQIGEFAAGPFGGPGSANPTRITGLNLTLKALLMSAFRVRYEQISGPPWLETQRYDLEARVAPGATSAQVSEMLQNLIQKRFALVLHHEMRELPLYDLERTKNRPYLRPSRTGANLKMPEPGKDHGFLQIPAERTTGIWQMVSGRRVRVVGRNQTISELVKAIGNQAGRPVVDKTGLGGTYDFILEYALVPGTIGSLGMPMPAPASDGLAPADDGIDQPPDLASALEDQLGLKLKSSKGPLDVLVIDHAEQKPLDQ